MSAVPTGATQLITEKLRTWLSATPGHGADGTVAPLPALPVQLEFQLFFPALAFVLNAEARVRGNVQALARHLDGEAAARFQRIRPATKFRGQRAGGVSFLDVSRFHISGRPPDYFGRVAGFSTPCKDETVAICTSSCCTLNPDFTNDSRKRAGTSAP